MINIYKFHQCPSLLATPGFELTTFRFQSGDTNHSAIPPLTCSQTDRQTERTNELLTDRQTARSHNSPLITNKQTNKHRWPKTVPDYKTNKQTNEQTNKQTNKHRWPKTVPDYKQTNKQTNKHRLPKTVPDYKANKRTNEQTNKDDRKQYLITNKQTNKHTNKQTNEQTQVTENRTWLQTNERTNTDDRFCPTHIEHNTSCFWPHLAHLHLYYTGVHDRLLLSSDVINKSVSICWHTPTRDIRWQSARKQEGNG